MHALTTIGRALNTAAALPAVANLLRLVTRSSFALFGLTGLFVFARRVTGDLQSPLSPAALLGLGVVLALAALALRATVCAEPPRGCLGLEATVSASLTFWVLGLAFGATSPLALASFCVPVLTEEAWSWRKYWQRRQLAGVSRASVFVPRERLAAAAMVRETTQSSGLFEVADEAEGEFGRDISQQIVRRRQPDGSEVLQGWVRAVLAKGQRHANVHLAICPPLAGIPECFAEQLDGPPAQIKVAQMLPFGVRLEVKLDRPSDGSTSEQGGGVVIEFVINERRRA